MTPSRYNAESVGQRLRFYNSVLHTLPRAGNHGLRFANAFGVIRFTHTLSIPLHKMNVKTIAVTFLILLIPLTTLAQDAAAKADKKDWIQLFNGRDIDGWT